MRYEATLFRPGRQFGCNTRSFEGFKDAKDFVARGLLESKSVFGCVVASDTGDLLFQVVSVEGGGVQEVAVASNS